MKRRGGGRLRKVWLSSQNCDCRMGEICSLYIISSLILRYTVQNPFISSTCPLKSLVFFLKEIINYNAGKKSVSTNSCRLYTSVPNAAMYITLFSRATSTTKWSRFHFIFLEMYTENRIEETLHVLSIGFKKAYISFQLSYNMSCAFWWEIIRKFLNALEKYLYFHFFNAQGKKSTENLIWIWNAGNLNEITQPGPVIWKSRKWLVIA